ncbi:MAG: hypothetical protein K5910_01670 [Bacteroidales bacterium]|nr:hypothetical protein [Bacteroidales bacterium]
MKKIITLLAALTFAAGLHAESVDLHWIDKAPAVPTGQSWGVPFAKGAMNEQGSFTLTDANGKVVPQQHWVLSRWSDGSVKWMGFYATLGPDQAGNLRLNAVKADKKAIRAAAKKQKNAPAEPTIVTSDGPTGIVIDNGCYEIAFPKSGDRIIERISMDGRTVVSGGRLVAQREDRSKTDVLSYEHFESRVTSAEVERSGPVAAVVKVCGVHKALQGGREWLPFTLRFYIFKDAAPIKMVHSFIYDGEQREDFIKGLGVQFDIPLREQLHNRHVAFAGDGDGLWDEAVEPFINQRTVTLPTQPGQRPAGGPGGPGGPGGMPNFAAMQFRGEQIPNAEEYDQRSQVLVSEYAKYDDYKLVQPNADGFTIQKRTGAHSNWFGTAGGHRARGLVLAGDATGGLSVSLKNFWQSFPAGLEASGMRGDTGKITVWLWSPDAPSMDMRHYDIEGHGLNASYEDWVEGYDTAYGIGRTSELTLTPFAAMPTREEISRAGNDGQDIVQLLPTPQALYDAKAFGVWSLPAKNGNDTQQFLEKQIDTYLKFYETNVESQRWYGFWNYGDVMHSYDVNRHTWNYDAGGKAWDNTELETDLWLWFGFIRSGRPDFWRMATAMTRHTSEVDAYHIGPMKGMGTRHNVMHWGCGAKEARVGQAWWKRYYYYLTTDDRLGDLMHDSLAANEAFLDYDPLVRAQPRSQFPTQQPTRLRWGPDWTSLVGNWFTEWERTGDQHWLDMIHTGMKSLSNLPNGLFTGQGPYGYDPATGVLTYEGDPEWITNRNHLANLQSSVEIFLEVLDEVGTPEFIKTYMEYASWYTVPQNDPIRDLPENARYKNWWGHWNIARLLGFAASRSGDEYRADLAWKRFLDRVVGPDGQPRNLVEMSWIEGPDVLNPTVEDARVSTNGVAQWNLEAIILQELLPDNIPSLKDIEPAPANPRR